MLKSIAYREGPHCKKKPRDHIYHKFRTIRIFCCSMYFLLEVEVGSVLDVGRVLLQLLPDGHALVAVVELLHEVPGLETGHPGDVDVVDGEDLVADVEHVAFVGGATC